MRVLVVEDERLLADAIAAGLRRHAMAVDVVYDGATALEHTLVNDYDVVVLDRNLPSVSGDVVCSELTRSNDTVRILMLTAATAVADRVAGLGLGADDYLAKPFAFAELVARVQALARRVPTCDPAHPGAQRYSTRPTPPRSYPRWLPDSAVPQGVRRTGRATARRRWCGVRRASAREGVGREHRPIHRRGPIHDHDGATKAWRPTANRDGTRGRGTASHELLAQVHHPNPADAVVCRRILPRRSDPRRGDVLLSQAVAGTSSRERRPGPRRDSSPGSAGYGTCRCSTTW